MPNSLHLNIAVETSWVNPGNRRSHTRISLNMLFAAVLLALTLPAQKSELPGQWKNWLNEDVRYIITDQEKRAFKSLKTDQERAQFIDQFWKRRDPTPDTEENEYKQEHYRRIAYANEQFASGVPGWKTDRGMIYIKFGPPDEIESHPNGDGQSLLPSETWRYRYIADVGTDIAISFVDNLKTGDYPLEITLNDRMTKALSIPAFPQPCLSESTSINNQKTICDPAADSFLTGAADAYKTAPQFKDLQALAGSPPLAQLPMQLRADHKRVTSFITSTHLTLQFNAGSQSNIKLYARLTGVNVPETTWFESSLASASQTYTTDLLLRPGAYRLNIAARDTTSNTTHVSEQKLVVPGFDENHLSASSLILVDHAGNTFKQSETFAISAQFYNFTPDPTTRKPQGTVEYSILRDTDGAVMISASDDLADRTAFPKASPFLVTVAKKFTLKSLPPGAYTLKIKVVDGVRMESLIPLVRFTVTL